MEFCRGLCVNFYVMTEVRSESVPVKKRKKNKRKHGVEFSRARYGFADPMRVIAESITHSTKDKRFFCFVKSMTEFSLGDSPIVPPLSVSLVQVTGEKER